MTESKSIQVIKVVKQETRAGTKERDEVLSILQSILKKMVLYPERILVSYVVGEKTTIFKVDCCQEDLGRVLGSKGKNINGLRAIVSSMTAMSGIRSIIEIPYYPPDNQEGG